MSSSNAAIQDRLHLINGNLHLNQEQIQGMKEIRAIISDAAYKMHAVIEKLPHDTGRLIASIDALQSVKDVACSSILLAPGLREKSQEGEYRVAWQQQKNN